MGNIRSVLTAALALAAVAAPLSAQPTDEAWRQCRGSDPRIAITACSTIIWAREVSAANRARAF
jgi:hypothetical protein